MLTTPVFFTTAMAFAFAGAIPQAPSATTSLSTISESSSIAATSAVSSNPPTYEDGDDGGDGANADYTFLTPTLQPFIHVEFRNNIPTNTSTILGLVGRVPNEGGNVTGAITGTIIPLGAAYEILPGGTTGDRGLYENRWSINVSTSAVGTDDGTATIIMRANAFVYYANENVFASGAITFEGRPETDLSYETFVGQVTSEFGTGVAILDVFKVVVAGRVDGEPILALEPPGEA